MLPASHPLLYACVFRGQTPVAELTSSDPSLAALAAALLAAAPPHHRHLTHSSGGRSHALLLAPPLSLLAISHSPSLPSPHLLLFLRRLRCLHLSDPAHLPSEMLRLALALPYDDAQLQREAAEVAALEEAAEEEVRRRRPAKAVGWGWRRQLWVVLVMDLVLVCVLFAAWVAVCKGFRCIGQP